MAASFSILVLAAPLAARPPYPRELRAYYGDLLPRALESCSTCHLREARPAAVTAGAGDASSGAASTAAASATGASIDTASATGAIINAEMPPHNPFGARLRVLGEELRARGGPWDLEERLRVAAGEDPDSDGFPSEVEILAGRRPGDPSDVPTPAEVRDAAEKRAQLARSFEAYRFRPFRRVERPPVPELTAMGPGWVRNPIDAFIAREHERHGLRPRPEAAPTVLLRRVYLDLIGLPPRPEELQAFLEDRSPGVHERPDAYERVVDRLLESPQYGERWGRHWMDVWRYSDWAGWGNQVRDSQPHIWRWRDWIVESLNADRGYDAMVLEMLAGDEIAPLDPKVLRATGYLARSFKLLSREAWMQEAVDHCAQAFLGVTLGCARCHDHRYDPISQREYYALRAVFEPYAVRLDSLPGQLDTAKDGLARAFDATPDAPTFLFIRGDDRRPDRSRPMAPGVPAILGGPPLRPEPVDLPLLASVPEKKDHVIEDSLAASREAARAARASFQAALLKVVQGEKALASAPEAEREKAARTLEDAREESELLEMGVPLAEAQAEAMAAVIRVERLEDARAGERDPEGLKKAATEAQAAQRAAALLEARRDAARERRASRKARTAAEAADKASAQAPGEKKLAEAARKTREELEAAGKRLAEADKRLAKAKEDVLLSPSPEYRKRDLKTYPSKSTGRRLAFARWLVHRDNPLAARVAVNHIWLRHFGQAIAPSVADLGGNGRPPSHPELLDWLAVELMEPTVTPGARPWSMKRFHRLLVTSSTYRMASTPDAASFERDPENRWLWRMSSRRLEAEAVRDAVLHAAGTLDLSRTGPELDQGLCLTTRRRTLYYRNAAEKQAEFLRLFDMAAPSECYERRPSVVPQQALALANSELTLVQARMLARKLSGAAPEAGSDARQSFVRAAFETVLSRAANAAELEASLRFLSAQEALLETRRGSLGPAAADPADARQPSADPVLRAREDLVHALFNHNDFVTVR